MPRTRVEALDQLLIAHAMGLLHRRHRAVERLGGEIANGQHLGARQPRRAQQFFRRRQNLLGRGKAVDQSAAGANALGVLGEQRLHARGDGGRNFAVELLIDDRLQQRLEDALRGFLLQAACAASGR